MYAVLSEAGVCSGGTCLSLILGYLLFDWLLWSVCMDFDDVSLPWVGWCGGECCIELGRVFLPLSPLFCYGVLWEAEEEKATTEQQPSSTMSTAGLGFAGLGYVVGGGRGGR